MSLRMPESMDECIYFTRRKMGDNGKIMAWVYRKDCPECGEKMGKPIDEKTGRPKVRAKEYACPKCGYEEPKQEHEESLQLEIIYTCPYCRHKGEASTDYKRKTWKGVKAYVFECGACGEKIGITKKLKAPKK